MTQPPVRKESFKVINGSNAKGVQAKIQTYCHVKIAALKLQRNKNFQFIVESDSQGGRKNDPVVGVNPKTLLSFMGAWTSIDVFDCKRLIVILRARAAPNKLHELIVEYHSKRSLHFGENFAILCEGE